MKRKILFFIDGPVPSAEQMSVADQLTNTKTIVCFRNAQQVTDVDGLEQCTSVAGCVPKQYSKFPRADEPELPLMPAEPTSLQPQADAQEPAVLAASVPAPATPASRKRR